jgi:hypothetical protein
MRIMTTADVQAWLDAYVAAWRGNERGPIEALFTEDATYRYHPWDDGDAVLNGREAIAASWLEHPDDPGTWEASYRPFVVEGDRAVAVGTSRYAARGDQPAQAYHNVYLLEFAPDGRCRSFTELFMLER